MTPALKAIMKETTKSGRALKTKGESSQPPASTNYLTTRPTVAMHYPNVGCASGLYDYAHRYHVAIKSGCATGKNVRAAQAITLIAKKKIEAYCSWILNLYKRHHFDCYGKTEFPVQW